MKAVLGSLVFLISLFVMRQVLVETGLLSPSLAVLFLVAAVGIPLGGIVFLEAGFERENEELRREIRALREEVAKLSRSAPPPPPADERAGRDVRERSIAPRE